MHNENAKQLDYICQYQLSRGRQVNALGCCAWAPVYESLFRQALLSLFVCIDVIFLFIENIIYVI